MLSWNVTSDLMACGPVYYNVTISSDGMMRMVNTTDTYYHFTGLTPGTDYAISIQPSNSAGSGQSYTDTIRTASNSECYYLCELVFVGCVYSLKDLLCVIMQLISKTLTYWQHFCDINNQFQSEDIANLLNNNSSVI